MKNNSDRVNTLLMQVKVHFLASGYVNKQNCRYWAPKNPYELHQRPLHNAKMTMWCAVSSYGIIDLYFLENADECSLTVNAEWYKATPKTFLRNELHTSSLARFDVDLVLGTSSGPPGRLNLQYQTTSSGATRKARYTKHVLPILRT
jgi:hypothetical protein